MKNVFLIILLVLSLLLVSCKAHEPKELNVETIEEKPMIQEIVVDYSKKVGVPLFKKYALFNSGIAPLDNYKRDISSITDLGVDSLRIDLFIGNTKMPFGKTIMGTVEKLEYDFSELDELAILLASNGVKPYWSWCYIPEPLQVSNDWRNGPKDLTVWQEMFEEFARHYKEIGLPIYHEVYNEPDCDDVFFLGTWEDYIQMYKFGAEGLLEGNPDAVIGGPATAFIEKQLGIDNFLQMVLEEELPLDFFSFHSYGYENKEYINRVQIARNALSKYPNFDTTEMHMNELNTIPFPWPKGGALDRSITSVTMLTAFKELLDETDLTLVHWAQWMSSTVDGLGMIDKNGEYKASMHAYEMYNEMPINRVSIDLPDNLHGLASTDSNTACLLLWNEEEIDKNVQVSLENIPFEQGKVEVYRLDDESYDYPKDASSELAPIVSIENIEISEYIWDGDISGEGILYFKIINNQSQEKDDVFYADIQRMYHYYPERGKSNYAEFDKKTSTAWIGMGNEVSAYSVVGISIDNAKDFYVCDLNFSGEMKNIDNDTFLGIRLDYRVDGEYKESAEFYVIEKNIRRVFALPWGTKQEANNNISIQNAITDNVLIDVKRYAPDNWDGNIIITFEMQNTGENTQAVFKIN